ncbi:MAG: hypothetical protein LBU06_08120, partial [Desulfovibrio sp.]|nr:hypothetical protein [Desulfovibrio sp.]
MARSGTVDLASEGFGDLWHLALEIAARRRTSPAVKQAVQAQNALVKVCGQINPISLFLQTQRGFPAAGLTHLVASALRRCVGIARSRRLRNSNFKSKLHPCSFDLAAAAQALFRLAARNASHFGVTSC